MSTQPLPTFPNYLQLRTQSRVPRWMWIAGRIASVTLVIECVALLLWSPREGMVLFWQLGIPLLPLVFFVVPGFWRNVCPLAAMNQLPRALSLSRGLTPPAWFREYGFVIGAAALLLLVSARKWLFDNDAVATASLILLAMGGALAGGLFFKGKSGWCSSICPMYPVQRLYNQTPFATVANGYCDPCVGCTKNCYDFNPKAAYLADLYDDDRHYRNHRKFFAALFPGFIVAFFTLPSPPAITLPAMYAQLLLYLLVSAGSFFALYALVKTSSNTLTAIYAVAALNLFYWFATPAWFDAVEGFFGVTVASQAAWVVHAVVLGLSLLWLRRTLAKEPLFVERMADGGEARIRSPALTMLRKAAREEKLEIRFLPQQARVLADAGRTLLEIAESSSQPIEAGCRMGMCGADPVLITEGMENLSAIGDEERSTLQRLGLGGNARLACMCRINGPVSVLLDAKNAGQRPGSSAAPPSPAWNHDPAVKQIVVVGNGIAGVTACDHIRRHHPDCEIRLIGQENHHLYNRMAISRLIYGRSAMSGLYLQPEAWYDERRIDVWLNTHVTSIDPKASAVTLGTGETLNYDRLILANGSSAVIPPVANFGISGTFALRDADDAMRMRGYVQAHRARRAVVAGGGLLGLETAYALHKLGLDVTILERSASLLRRQLDPRGGDFLRRFIEGMGMEVLVEAEVAVCNGSSRLTEVVLKDERVLPADVLLVAAGVKPNAALAREAGITVNRGVLVDEHMRTSIPTIYAAGDVSEFEGAVPGLWPVAVEQARVAAINAIGGSASYQPAVSVCTLKVLGVELTSIGVIEPRSDADVAIALEDLAERRYRKIVVSDGKIVGAILLGHPEYTQAVTRAATGNLDVSAHLEALRAGDWDVLSYSEGRREAPQERRVDLVAHPVV